MSLVDSLQPLAPPFAGSRAIDRMLNPYCYGLSNPSPSCCPAIMSSDLIVCTGGGPSVDRHHRMTFIQDEISIDLSIGGTCEGPPRSSSTPNSEGVELFVLSRSVIDIEVNMLEARGTVTLVVSIETSFPIPRLHVARRHSWHGVDYRTGLPVLDSKPHNGYSGVDRFLWIRDPAVPWIAAPVHFPHAPVAPGMNVAFFFHLLAPFHSIEGDSVV